MRPRLPTLLALLLSLAGSLGTPALRAQDDPERELERIQREIAALERDLERQVGRRDDGMAELRELELALAESHAELDELAGAIAAQTARQAAILDERRAANERLDGEQAALAEQVRMSYMTGRQEIVRMLLSQENAADVGRMLVYYDYLNQHRGQRIEAVDAELGRLASLAQENEEVGRELGRLRSAQEARAARLEGEQAERRALLARLDAEIESSGSRIDQMRAEQLALEETIARLAEILAGFPVNSDAPFAAQRGNLSWPVAGPLAARFGDKRDADGFILWDGVLIEAPTGTAVRAVYQGRVIHAQWHPHMGLLLILDHGDGYWTLYGHNSALLRSTDDWVRAGDVIAEVGSTGGRVDSALYFSILANQQPVDPADWVR